MKIAPSANVTLLTPTRDAPVAFALCEKWMARQTYQGSVRWIVIDDADTPQACSMNQDHIRRPRSAGEPVHTLPCNLLAAIPFIDSDITLVIENDDLYKPQYVERMVSYLSTGKHEAIGESHHRKYDVKHQRFWVGNNTKHGSLCCTGLRRSALPKLEAAARAMEPFVDIRVWAMLNGRLIRSGTPESPGCVGIKGLPGYHPPVTQNGRIAAGFAKSGQADHGKVILRQWCGDDAAEYERFYNP